MITPIIIALDYSNIRQVLTFIDTVSPQQCRLKIGKELFTRVGPSIVRTLQNRGFDIFLDLKFYDIPNTISKSIVAAAELGVWMISIHASAGKKIMEAASNALIPFNKNAPILVGVTVLTSMNDLDIQDVGISDSVSSHTLKLAVLAQQCGLNGVICSAWEAKQVRNYSGTDFILVSPGIRPLNCKINDQMRIMTPIQARQTGIDYMIIGRPITQDKNPAVILSKIIYEINNK